MIEYDKQSPRLRHDSISTSACRFSAATFLALRRTQAIRSGGHLSGPVADGPPGGIRGLERFYEIGSPQGMSDTEEYLTAAIVGNA